MEHHHHQHQSAGGGGGMSQGYPGDEAVLQQQQQQQEGGPPHPPAGAAQGPYHQQHQLLQQQQQQLHMFWAFQMQEIEQVSDFKNHQLPLARIKKIMKADEDVRMISAEAPVLFAKACEMFILELTLRSWIHAEENKRRTLQKNDIAAAITRTDIFDFLVDIVPRDDSKEEGLGLARAGLPEGPYYYPPMNMNMNMNMAVQPGMTGSPSIMMGRPAPAAMQIDPSLYRAYGMPGHQPMQQQQVWQLQQQQQQQMPDGQAFGHLHQQQHQMPDGQSYVQHPMPDAHSYGTPPPPAD